MRSKQVQILSGICGVQLIGYACRAAGFKTDIWIGFTGSVFLMLDIVYLAIQEKGRKKCPECDSEISKKVRICPECGYLFQQGLSEEQLTGYIEQEQEKGRIRGMKLIICHKKRFVMTCNRCLLKKT